MPTFPFRSDHPADRQPGSSADQPFDADPAPWWEPQTRLPYTAPSMTTAVDVRRPEAPPATTAPSTDQAPVSAATDPAAPAPATPTAATPAPATPTQVAQPSASPAGVTAAADQPTADSPADRADPAPAERKAATDLPQKRPPGLTGRGAYLTMLAGAVVGCLLGFIISGTVTIPALTGWGLIIGSVTAALLAPERLGWTVVWLPPLAMATVVAVFGQVTLLGSLPSPAREVAMLAANLTTTAPAQLVSVIAAAGILFLRRRASGAVAAAGRPNLLGE